MGRSNKIDEEKDKTDTTDAKINKSMQHPKDDELKELIDSSPILLIGHNNNVDADVPGSKDITSLIVKKEDSKISSVLLSLKNSSFNEHHVNEDCVVYSGYKLEIWGNVNKNQYSCVSTTKNYSANLRKFLRDNTIRTICVNVAGSSVFWITDTGKVFGNGKNDANQLGDVAGRHSFNVNAPSLIHSLTNLGCIMDIQSSLTYSIALRGPSRSTMNTIVTFWNHNKSIPEDILNMLVSFCGIGNVYTTKDNGPTWKEMKLSANKDIIKIKSGCDHSLILQSNGILWSFGGNGHGQLGLGHTDNVKVPTIIEYFVENDIKIKDIACGFDHNLAIDYNNKVYSWGYNRYHQCGREISDMYCSTPELIPLLKIYDIELIDCGSHHSFCQTVGGKMYFFGSNRYNECIIGHYSTHLPICVNEILKAKVNDREIKSVSLGYRNTKIIMCDYSGNF